MRLDGLPLAYRSPYLFRLRPTFGEMRARLEERLAERTRIAQDLHDTVLQGIFSAAMQLHVAVDQLPFSLFGRFAALAFSDLAAVWLHSATRTDFPKWLKMLATSAQRASAFARLSAKWFKL